MWEIKAVIASGLEQGGESGLSTCVARVFLLIDQRSNLSFSEYLFIYNGLAPRGKAKA